MYYKRIFIITTVVVSILAFLWVGHSTLISAAKIVSSDTAVFNPQPDNITAVLSGTNIMTETFKLTSPMPVTNGRYGFSVAIYNNTLIVGEPETPSNQPGNLYVYEQHDGGLNNWGLTKIITPSDYAAGYSLGSRIAFDGETILAGAGIGHGLASESGAAFLFERNAGGANNWGEVAKFIAPDGGANDRFGWSLALDGNTAVIGAKAHNHIGGRSGAVYIYERNYGGLNKWGLVKEFSSSNAPEVEAFGFSVAIEGDTLVVGADAQDANGYLAGLVYVYERNEGGANNWGEVAQISPDSPLSFDLFGSSVLIEGDLIVVGSRQASSSRSGNVRFFGRHVGGTNNWGQITKLTPSDGTVNNSFGYHLSLKDNVLLVSGYQANGVVNNSGAAYIFKQDDTDPNKWVETAKLVSSDGKANDAFGWDVSFFGNTYAVGSDLNDPLCQNCDAGAVYIYTPIHQVYLPTILSLAADSFPIHIGPSIPGQPINQGDDFYTATVAIPRSIPTIGQFFLSADFGYISKIGVDDELAIVLDGNEIFVKTFALNGSAIHQEIVEMPRNVMEQMAGQTVSVIYRDVHGQQASASEVWLIWAPEVP